MGCAQLGFPLIESPPPFLSLSFVLCALVYLLCASPASERASVRSACMRTRLRACVCSYRVRAYIYLLSGHSTRVYIDAANRQLVQHCAGISVHLILIVCGYAHSGMSSSSH